MTFSEKKSLLSNLYVDTAKPIVCYIVAGEGTMPRGKRKEDQAMLEMALIGYQHEREKLVGRIQELHARLKGTTTAPTKTAPKAGKRGGRKVMDAAARKRISAAQKQRWVEYHKRQAASQA